MAWWREARFGIFVHWGVSSLPAGAHKGRVANKSGEWMMHSLRVPVADYQRYAEQFNPVRFDARAWVRAVKAAGARYLVITTKHHDGFALFATKASRWNVVDATPCGRDLIRELADACHAEGIRLGFYYSQAQDWVNGGSAAGGNWDPAQDRPMDEYIHEVAVPQVRELLSNYGPGVPAVIFWDTPEGITPARAARIAEVVRELAPDVITNSRLGCGVRGDFDSPEGFIPSSADRDGDWEVCMTMNESWGYTLHDTKWKTGADVIRQLCEICAKGGNYLLNVGPKGDGAFPPESERALAEMGRWMEVHSDSIYGVGKGPFPHRLTWGFAASKGHTIYLYIFDWPEDGRLAVPLENRPARVWSLARPGDSLPCEFSEDGFAIVVGPEAHDPAVSVIAIELEEAPVLGTLPPPPPLIPQTADGSMTLNAGDARLTGSHIGSARGLIVGWGSVDSHAQWRVDVKHPGRYRVTLEHAVGDSHAGSTLRLANGRETLTFVVPTSGGWKNFVSTEVGELVFPEGGAYDVTLHLERRQTPGSVGDLRSFVLQMVQAVDPSCSLGPPPGRPPGPRWPAR